MSEVKYALTEQEAAEAIFDWIKKNRGYKQTSTVSLYWKPTWCGTINVSIEEGE